MKINGLRSICLLCDKVVKTVAPRNTTEYDECRTCCPPCVVSSLAGKAITDRRR